MPRGTGGAEAQGGSMEGTLMIGAIIVALVGIFIAYYLYIKRPELPERVREEVPSALPHGQQQVLRG